MRTVENEFGQRRADLVFWRNIPHDWTGLDTLLLEILSDSGYGINIRGGAKDGFGAERPDRLAVFVREQDKDKIKEVFSKLEQSDIGRVTAAALSGNVSLFAGFLNGDVQEISPGHYTHPKNLHLEPGLLEGYLLTAYTFAIRKRLDAGKPLVDGELSEDIHRTTHNLTIQGRIALTRKTLKNRFRLTLSKLLEDQPLLIATSRTSELTPALD